MWSHAISLAHRSWDAFITAIGSTTLGFTAPFVVPIIGFLLVLLVAFTRQGRKGVGEHIKRTLTIAAFVGLTGGLIVYGSIFGWSVIKTIFVDHQAIVSERNTLRDRIQVLTDENTKLLSENKNLSERHHIETVRHITKLQIERMKAALLPFERQKLAIITLKGPGNGERLDYAAEIKDALGQCGWDSVRKDVETFSKDRPGVLLIKHSQENNPDFRPISVAFAAAKIKYEIVNVGHPMNINLYSDGISTDFVIIFVGSNPKS